MEDIAVTNKNLSMLLINFYPHRDNQMDHSMLVNHNSKQPGEGGASSSFAKLAPELRL